MRVIQGTKVTAPRHTCASLNTIAPCVVELSVAGFSAVLEPSAALSATATFPRFCGNTALVAYGTDDC